MATEILNDDGFKRPLKIKRGRRTLPKHVIQMAKDAEEEARKLRPRREKNNPHSNSSTASSLPPMESFVDPRRERDEQLLREIELKEQQERQNKRRRKSNNVSLSDAPRLVLAAAVNKEEDERRLRQIELKQQEQRQNNRRRKSINASVTTAPPLILDNAAANGDEDERQLREIELKEKEKQRKIIDESPSKGKNSSGGKSPAKAIEKNDVEKNQSSVDGQNEKQNKNSSSTNTRNRTREKKSDDVKSPPKAAEKNDVEKHQSSVDGKKEKQNKNSSLTNTRNQTREKKSDDSKSSPKAAEKNDVEKNQSLADVQKEEKNKNISPTNTAGNRTRRFSKTPPPDQNIFTKIPENDKPTAEEQQVDDERVNNPHYYSDVIRKYVIESGADDDEEDDEVDEEIDVGTEVFESNTNDKCPSDSPSVAAENAARSSEKRRKDNSSIVAKFALGNMSSGGSSLLTRHVRAPVAYSTPIAKLPPMMFPPISASRTTNKKIAEKANVVVSTENLHAPNGSKKKRTNSSENLSAKNSTNSPVVFSIPNVVLPPLKLNDPGISSDKSSKEGEESRKKKLNNVYRVSSRNNSTDDDTVPMYADQSSATIYLKCNAAGSNKRIRFDASSNDKTSPSENDDGDDETLKHYAETTHLNDVEKKPKKRRHVEALFESYLEPPKIIIPDPSKFTPGLRRSTRTRIVGVTRQWAGEHVQYDYDRDRQMKIVGIEKAYVKEPILKRHGCLFRLPYAEMARRRKLQGLKPKKSLNELSRNLSIHAKNVKEFADDNTSTRLTNDDESFVARKSDLIYVNSNEEPASENDAFVYAKSLDNDSFTCGNLIIRPFEICNQFTTTRNTVFTITFGKLLITVNGKERLLGSGDVFSVDDGDNYTIKNLRRDNAKLNFVSVNVG